MASEPLYEIVAQLAEMEQELVDAEGVLTPEAEAALAKLEGTLEEKCTHMFAFVRNQLGLAAQRKQEAQRLYALAKANERRAHAIEEYMLEEIKKLPARSVQTRLGRLQPMRNSTPTLKPVEGEVDERFLKTTVEPDSAEALAYWRDVVRGKLDGLEGKARQLALPEAYAAATRALRSAGFHAELGYHLRAYS